MRLERIRTQEKETDNFSPTIFHLEMCLLLERSSRVSNWLASYLCASITWTTVVPSCILHSPATIHSSNSRLDLIIIIWGTWRSNAAIILQWTGHYYSPMLVGRAHLHSGVRVQAVQTGFWPTGRTQFEPGIWEFSFQSDDAAVSIIESWIRWITLAKSRHIRLSTSPTEVLHKAVLEYRELVN